MALDSKGKSLLYIAMNHGDFEMVKKLVDAGADLNVSKDGFGIIETASLMNQPAICEYLRGVILERLKNKVALLNEPDTTSSRFHATILFKEHFKKIMDSNDSIGAKYTSAESLFKSFTIIDEMLDSISHLNDPKVKVFIDNTYQYLSSDTFINDVNSAFYKITPPERKISNNLKKLSQELQENHVSQSYFSFLSNFHPQSETSKTIANVAERKHRFRY